MLCKEPHCISLNGLGTHFRTYHSDSVSKQQRAALVKYTQTLSNELKDPNEVISPSWEEGPVEGLHKFEGYECMWEIIGVNRAMLTLHIERLRLNSRSRTHIGVT